MIPPSAEAISIRNLTRRFGTVTALDNISLSVRQGEFLTLLGPSGCGKTTLLRLIAGLESADAGTVWIAGADATSLPAHRRPVNTVFQSYALFPHLDVWNNVAFGLRMKKLPGPEIDTKVRSVLGMVQISDLEERRPHQLSGGQKQRVALARAIVNEPQVLLLDEPLAALDLHLRKQLQLELRQLQQRLGMTFLYVTHDQEEALVLSDRIAVMRSGRIEQLGGARELYERPRTRFVSQFLGACSLIQAELQQASPDGALFRTPLGPLQVNMEPPARPQVTLAIRPEKVQLFPAKPSGLSNVIPATIERVAYAGSESHYDLRAGSQFLRAELMNQQETDIYSPAQEVWVRLRPDAITLLDD